MTEKLNPLYWFGAAVAFLFAAAIALNKGVDAGLDAAEHLFGKP